jgi:hypothetical protein
MTSLARELLVAMAFCLFALSSAFTTLVSRSSTSHSRWVILFCCTLLRSFCSTILFWSYVISPCIVFHNSFSAAFLSCCSNLTSTAVSPISVTLFSRALPAVCTALICSYASACHANAAFCFVRTFCTNAA